MAKRITKKQAVTVEPEQIIELRRIKRQTGKTLKFLVHESIDDFIEKQKICKENTVRSVSNI